MIDEREKSQMLPLHAEPPPLRVDEGGAVCVGKSRVSLDLVVEQYENGMTPEDLVRAYDTLVLADVHAVIAYYLRHREEVRAYLKRREAEAEALRAKIEAAPPASRAKNCSHPAVPGRRPMLRLASDADVHGGIIRGLPPPPAGNRLGAPRRMPCPNRGLQTPVSHRRGRPEHCIWNRFTIKTLLERAGLRTGAPSTGAFLSGTWVSGPLWRSLGAWKSCLQGGSAATSGNPSLSSCTPLCVT